MNEQLKFDVQAYLDNELTPAEGRRVASLLEKDPEAQVIFRELKETKAILANNELPLTLKEPRDFYFSQIQRAIAAQEKTAARPAHKSPWWLRIFAPVAGVTAVLALVLSLVNVDNGKLPIRKLGTDVVAQASPKEASPLHDIEATPAEASAITFHSESEGVTVVWVSSNE